MAVLVFDQVIVEGEVICTMISPTSLQDAIVIANIQGCNVIIKHFHSWKMIRTPFYKNHIYSPGSTMYLIT
jgi:hypothetical protein